MGDELIARCSSRFSAFPFRAPFVFATYVRLFVGHGRPSPGSGSTVGSQSPSSTGRLVLARRPSRHSRYRPRQGNYAWLNIALARVGFVPISKRLSLRQRTQSSPASATPHLDGNRHRHDVQEHRADIPPAQAQAVPSHLVLLDRKAAGRPATRSTSRKSKVCQTSHRSSRSRALRPRRRSRRPDAGSDCPVAGRGHLERTGPRQTPYPLEHSIASSSM